MTKIIILDDKQMNQVAIKSMLQLDVTFKVVGEGVIGNDVQELYKKNEPDIVLMDITLPSMNGIEATIKLMREQPKAKVILFSIHDGYSYVSHALKAGVRGYMLKEMNPSSIHHAIKVVAAGGSYIHPKVTHNFLKEFRELSKNEFIGNFNQPKIRKPYHLLTVRESEVLQLLADGQSNRTIGETTGISEKTVKNHVSNILTKMEVENRTNAVVTAIRNGWVEVK